MNFVQLLRKANDLKAQLTAEGGSDAWVTRQGLQDAYHQLLLGDLETALDKKLEQELWNHVFKNHISSLQHKARDRMNPKRSEVQAMLSLVLDNASGFYIQLLQEICSGFGVELACRIKAQRLGLFSEVLPSPQKLVQPKAASCLYICQHCLVHLGDIARYRSDTQQAESFYCHAASLVPSNGQPYNQLAIVSATKGDQLSMVFYYIRSIAVKHPFPAAATNLQTTYAKLVDRDEVKIFKMKEVELIHYFIKFHAIIYLASCEQDLQVAGSIKDKLEENFRSHLCQEILTSRQLTQMAAINLYALHTVRQHHTSNGQRSKTSGGSNTGSGGGSGSGGELGGLAGVVDTSGGKPYVANNAQCWTLTMGFSFNLLQMMLHYMPQKAGESPLDAWPGLPAIRLLLGWIFLQQGIFDDPVLTSKTSVWSKLGRVLTSLQVDSAPSPDDSTSSLPLPEDSLLDGFTPLQEFQRDLDFGQSKRSGWERSAMNQERCQRLTGQGKWLAHHQPSLLKVETSAGKLVFTSPLGDDAASRRSSHQQRQQRAAKSSVTSKGVETGTKSMSPDVKEGTKKMGRDGIQRRESRGEDEGQSKTIAVQAIMSRPSTEGGKSVTFKVQEKSSQSSGPSKSSKQTSTKEQDAPKRHVQWQNPPHAFAQEPSYFPQQKASHPTQPQQQQQQQASTQTGQPAPKGIPSQQTPQASQGHISSQPPPPGHMQSQQVQGHLQSQQPQGHIPSQQAQGHMPHGHAPPPRHPHPQAAQFPQQGPPPPQHLPHTYGYPPPRGPPPPSLGLPPDQRFPPPPLGPRPPFPSSQNAPPPRGMPPGPPPLPHGHSGPPGWPQMPPHMDGGRPDGQKNVQRDDSSPHMGRDGMPPPHMQPPKVQIPPPMPQRQAMGSPNSNIAQPQLHQQHPQQSQHQPPHGGWRRESPLGPLERPEDRPSADTMTNISLWNAASLADGRKETSGHLPRGASDNLQHMQRSTSENPQYQARGASDIPQYQSRGASDIPPYQPRGVSENPHYQQHQHQTSGMGSRRDNSPMRSPVANSPQFRLSPSAEDFGMQQAPGMNLQTSQSQPMPRRMSNPSEMQGFGPSSSYNQGHNQGQRNYMPSASMLQEQRNLSIRQQQTSQLPGGPPPQILDNQGANLLELLARMQKQIAPDVAASAGKPGFPQEFQSDSFKMDNTNPPLPQQQKSAIKDPPGFSKLPEEYSLYRDHQLSKDTGGLGVSDYFHLQQEHLKDKSQGPSLIRSGPPGESAFRKVQPQQHQQQPHREEEDSLFLRSGVESKDPRNQSHPFSYFAPTDGNQQEKQQLIGGESFAFGRNVFGQESRMDEPAQPLPYRRASGGLYETSTKPGALSNTSKDQPWGTNGREGGQPRTLDEGLLDFFPSHAPGSRSGSGSGSDKLSASFDSPWKDGGSGARDQRSRDATRRSSSDALYTQMNAGANGGSFFSGGSGSGNKGNPSDEENVFSSSGGSYSLFSSPSPWSARQDEDGSKAGEGLGGSLGLKWREPQLSSSPTSSLLPERIQSIWSSPVRSEQSPLEKILGHKVSLDQQKPDT